MKILQVIDVLNIGGAERVFVDMCNILYENQNDVSVLILLEDEGELSKDLIKDIPIIKLNRKNNWNFLTMYRCSKILKKYNIIHCHLRHTYKYIAFVNFIFNAKLKIVFQDHGSAKVKLKEVNFIKKIIKPKYYIGVSTNNTYWANTVLNIEEAKIFLLENIVIKKSFTKQPNKLYDAVLVSNIKPNKNNLFVVSLCESLNFPLLLVGKNQDESYYAEIEKHIKGQININSSVSDAQEIMSQAKIGFHASKSETGPLVIIEYLAQELPFLAYETGEIAKILKPYFPEYFINNFEEKQWIEKINLLLKTKPNVAKMQEVFEKHFGKEQYYNKLTNIYKCINS